VSQQTLLKRVVEALEGAGIPYLVSGSLASSLQGEPRSTHDIDLVIDVPKAASARLLEALRMPDLYVDESALLTAVDGRTVFNLLDPDSGDKVDFWLLTDEEYDVSRFRRKLSVDALGLRLSVSAPEDTILIKLRWSRSSGGSEKQVADARGVYEVQMGVLDERYLDEWAARLGVAELLARIRAEAEPLDHPG
jgi:hypothetical protein